MFCILDALIDVSFFSDESFLDELILHPSAYETYFRLLGIAFIVIPGIIVSRAYAHRQKVEEELKSSIKLIKTILNSTDDAISVINVHDYTVQAANTVYLNQLELKKEEDAIGGLCYKLTHNLTGPCEAPDNVCPLTETLVSGKYAQAEHRHYSTDGSKKSVEVSTYPIRDNRGKIIQVVHVSRDITERKHMEEERQKAAKLESIGTLAGGIAHDFNNILTVILGNIQLAESYLGKDRLDTALEMLAEAEKASFRARALTQQLLTFSKGGAPVRKVMQINEMLKETATFVLRGSNCKPDFAIARDMWTLEVDEGQLGQVLSNLVINASQAMPNGGVINIKASNLIVGQQSALSLTEGRYVEIAVEDHGIGIPEGNKSRIFEPYFTTKQKGSGLGLATSYSIIKNHGGIITVESTLGVGSTFHVYLPVTTEKGEEKKSKPAEAAKQSPLTQGRILVMDDEETIRRLLGKMLQSIGYEVELTADGAEAIERYTEAMGSGKPYDVIILDLTIPGGMGGREVVAKLLEINPGVKAIVSSGYASDPIMADYKRYGFSGVVSKPYNLARMQATLSDILAGK